MSENNMTLEQRVSLLETHRRRWQAAASILGVLLIAALSLGQTRPSSKNLDVESIRFRDSTGRTRILLACTPPDQITEFTDSDRKAAGTCFTGVAMFGKSGERTATLEMSNAITRMSFDENKEDQSGIGRSLSISASGFGVMDFTKPALALISADLISVGGLGSRNAAAINKTGFSILDENGNTRAVLGTAETANKLGATKSSSPGSLTLFDGDGKVLFQQP